METVIKRPPKDSRKEKYYFYNTLAGFVKHLEQEYVLIDLQNESSVSGKIVYVDGYMNVDLENVIFYDARYIHITKQLSPVEVFKKQLEPRIKQQPKPKRTFKKKRAQLYHDEIVKSAFGSTGTTKTDPTD
ncbi:hypothetical protein FQA39_LY08071 [Lamprigera yunnana]|nr:hypothetical protein FQA39_LY08071 [Lamprigera yunnana]